jgi:hypothetical protein
VTATDPAIRGLDLIGLDLEHRSASGAASNQAHRQGL